MPILKQLVSSTNQSKRRSRADLTAEMISAPLGDFRHTMHVGRGGDAFGDTSFLSSRSGEAPREAEPKQASPAGPKPGLLSRTFRSSKRSQSVNRGDKYQYKTVAAGVPAPIGGGTSGFVKNAISLPYLNNDQEELSSRGAPPPPPLMSKSVSSSPLRTNGSAAIAKLDPELDERNFGELMELPPSLPRGGGMKHAESMMSFHIDLGPSMLGDILGVMEKKGWEDDDLGYEEGRPSPSHIPLIDDDDDLEGEGLRVGVGAAPARPPRSLPPLEAEPYSPELQTRNNNSYQQHQDSCSVSSSGSALEDKRRYYGGHDGDTDSAKFSSPRAGGGGGGGGSFGGTEDDRDFSYMDEEDEDDEEIRV